MTDSKRTDPRQPGTEVLRTDSMVESKSPRGGAQRHHKNPLPTGSSTRKKRSTTRSGSKKKPVKVTTRGQIEKVVDCLIDLLRCYGYNADSQPLGAKRTHEARLSTVDHWTRLATAVGGKFSWMKVAKWKLAAFFYANTAQALTEPPPQPEAGGLRDLPGTLLCGVLGRYASSLAHRKEHESLDRRTRRLSFLQSILLSKKGMPRPTQEMVDQQVKDTVSALTSQLGSDRPSARLLELLSWGDEQELEDAGVEVDGGWDSIVAALEATVDELFAGVSYDVKKANRPYFPSTKSSFEDPLNKGGQFTAIRRLAQDIHAYATPNRVRMEREVTPIAPEPQKGERYQVVERYEDGSLRHVSTYYRGEESIRSYGPSGRWLADTTGLDEAFLLLRTEAMKLALRSDNKVRPVGLAEALKVRVITKGDPYVGFVLKPIQKMCWKVLRSHPNFALVGTPVTAEIVTKIIGAIEPKSGQFYLSGDYSAATDNLNPRVSEIIARRIARVTGIPKDEEELFVRALTSHRFEARAANGLDQETPQRWGQLMGSVVSFPVLCIANAAMCRWALEIDQGRPLPLADSPLLVNGDDCLLRCTKRGHEAWLRLSSAIGLTPSLGKYYVSREFANINSTCFVPNTRSGEEEEDVDFTFELVPSINLGLMYGMKRSSEEVSSADVAGVKETLGSRGRELMATCPDWAREDVWKRFLNHHWDKLNKETGKVRVPWYMPEAWGGVGLPPMLTKEARVYERAVAAGDEGVTPPSEYFVGSYGPTKDDLQCAALILSSNGKYSFRNPASTVDWATWKMAINALPAKPMSMTEDISERRGFDRLVNSLVVDTLFGRQSPFQPGKKMSRVGALGANEKTWHAVFHAKNRPSVGASWLTITAAAPLPPILELSTMRGLAFASSPYRFNSKLYVDAQWMRRDDEELEELVGW